MTVIAVITVITTPALSSLAAARTQRLSVQSAPARVDSLYLTGISRFIGILEVVKPPYKDTTKLIWKDDVFPCRLGVKPIEVLTPPHCAVWYERRNRDGRLSKTMANRS
ncbi:MAG: hypothetical protein LAP87_25355 [Acidobacteriia bacterium]|nr:hypothetical protein [Terriglobia bacterium]